MTFDWKNTFGSPKLIAIAGRPCMGKTTMALKLAQKIAETGNVAVIENEDCTSRERFEKQLNKNTGKLVLVVDTMQKLIEQMGEEDDEFIINELKRFIEDNQCNVIVTLELTRAVEERKPHFPSVYDLVQPTGRTKAMFDMFGAIYRESYYKIGGCNDACLIFKDADDNVTFVLTDKGGN